MLIFHVVTITCVWATTTTQSGMEKNKQMAESKMDFLLCPLV